MYLAGVRLKSGEVLDAAVVADTSGRFSGVSESLQRSGYTAPKEERIGAGLGYGARTYEWLPGSHELQVDLHTSNPGLASFPRVECLLPCSEL